MYVMVSTCPDKETAKKIAKTLVEKNLVACASIVKIEESIYKWQGKLVEESEYLLIMKAKKDKYDRIEMVLKINHPHKVPELICMEVTKGNKEYIDWVTRF